MPRKLFIILFFLFFIRPLHGLAQSATGGLPSFAQDSAVSPPPFTFFLTEKSFDKGNYSQVDTLIESYHYYLPGFFHNFRTLGNSGSPGQTMYYNNPKTTGFNTGINFLGVYASKKEEVQYYNTRKPYSKVFFLMGSKEEQILNVKHSQNIGSRLNIGLDYTNISSTGFYQRQKVRGNNFLVHSHFETKNKFYGNFANFIYHKNTVEENGGLYDETIFEEGLEERKDAMEVNLLNASNTYKKKSWYLKQYLNFGKREDVFDAKDSITRKVVSPMVRFSHTFSFEKQIFSFKDVDPDQFKYLLLFSYDRARTPVDTIKDSINVKIFENTFSLSTVDFTALTGKHYGFKNFYAAVFVKHQDIKRLTHNDIFDSTFQNLMAGGEFNFRFLKMFSVGGNAVQVANGLNKGDHYYKGFLEFSPASSMENADFNAGQVRKDSISSFGMKSFTHRVRIESFHQVKHPDWIFAHYFSDQLQWQYDFLNNTYSGQSISYSNEKWKLNVGISQNYFKNPVYFSSADIFSADTIFIATRIIPQQRKGRLTINQAYLSKHFRIWNFHLKTNIYFQETSNEIILPFPEFITYNSFYYENLMLRKSIFGQIGVDFYYHTGYYANAYSPFLKQFYLQSEKLVGNYPFFDFFINIKIKSVRAFFKITHANSGFSGNIYYLIPQYPQPDRAFRFGIDWRFLD